MVELSRKVRRACRQNVNIGVWPVNKMILDMLRIVKTNKEVRRVRYHDSALEAFRWLTRRPGLHKEELSKILWENE